MIGPWRSYNERFIWTLNCKYKTFVLIYIIQFYDLKRLTSDCHDMNTVPLETEVKYVGNCPSLIVVKDNKKSTNYYSLVPFIT